MGKTFKRLPTGIVRKPKGFKRAKINGARNRAVPSTAWDDKQYDDQVYIPFAVAERMQANGATLEIIRSKLKKKFKLKPFELNEIINFLRS